MHGLDSRIVKQNATSNLSQLQRPSFTRAGNMDNDRLLKFLKYKCTKAMERSKYMFNAGLKQDNRWTVGDDTTIVCQARIDSGAFGIVFRVNLDPPFVLFTDIEQMYNKTKSEVGPFLQFE